MISFKVTLTVMLKPPKCSALCLTLLLGIDPIFAAEQEENQQAGFEACQQISSTDYETGLWLNPEGYRSYYKRSACMQRLAIEFRDPSLCDEVRRRLALFSSSWGYSRRNCRSLVAEKLDRDRSGLEELRNNYLNLPMTAISVTLEPNGNGRDFDIIPRFSEGLPQGYELQFYLVEDNGARHQIFRHDGFLAGSESNLRLYLPRQELLANFPGIEFGRDYMLETSVTLSVGQRYIDGWLRRELLDEVFPRAERTQTLSSQARF